MPFKNCSKLSFLLREKILYRLVGKTIGKFYGQAILSEEVLPQVGGGNLYQPYSIQMARFFIFYW